MDTSTRCGVLMLKRLSLPFTFTLMSTPEDVELYSNNIQSSSTGKPPAPKAHGGERVESTNKRQ